MRILLVADTAGGVSTFTRALTGALSARGVEVHLALLGPGGCAGFDAASSCRSADLRLEWMEDPWEDLAATAAWLEALLEELGPDVVHMNTFAPVRDAEIPVVLSAHSDVLTWWRAVHGRPAPGRWERYRRLVARALERAAVVVAPTRALLGELRAVYGPLPAGVVIPNAVPLPPPSEAAPRERLVTSVGRLWDPAKNAGLLVAAAPTIRGRVALIGQGPAEHPRVRWLGPIPHARVIEWLCRTAVFAEPARYEPFGLAALEAALCGCALVLGDIPSLREVWGPAADYVSPDDPAALAAAVNALLDDPRRRAARARAARAAALRRTTDDLAAAYLRAYERAVAGRRRERGDAAAVGAP